MSDDTSGTGLTRRRLLAGLGAIGAAGAASGAGTFAYFRDSATSNGNTVEAGTLKLNIHDDSSLQWSMIGAVPGSYESTTQDVVFEHTGSVAADHLKLRFHNYPREDNDGHPGNKTSPDLNPGPASDTNTTALPGPNTGSDFYRSDPGAEGMAQYVRLEELKYIYGPKQPASAKQTWTFLTTTIGGVSGNGLDRGQSTPDSNPSNGKSLMDKNGNGFIDLDDLTHPHNKAVLGDLTPPDPGSTPGYGAGGSENDSIPDTELKIQLTLDHTLGNKYQGDAVITNLVASLEQA